jgi:hypothetical protein
MKAGQKAKEDATEAKDVGLRHVLGVVKHLGVHEARGPSLDVQLVPLVNCVTGKTEDAHTDRDCRILIH